MGFADAEKEFKRKTKKEKPEWDVQEVLAEIKKNKTDVIRITRVMFDGKELINLQVWREGTNGTSYPVKDQKISFGIDFRDKIANGVLGLDV